MTTILPIPTGPTNREIIDRAYRALALKDSVFGRSAEEYAVGIEVLASMMYEPPFDTIGYVHWDSGEGNRVEERSGIAPRWLEAVGLMLAERLAPVIGKSLSPEMMAAKCRAYSQLCASVPIPDSKYADGTPRGAGARHRYTYGSGTFFDNSVATEETVTPTPGDPLADIPAG